MPPVETPSCTGNPAQSYGLQYVAHQVAPEGLAAPPTAVDVEIVDRPPPELWLEQARQHLDLGHEPWVYYQDATTGRGHVVCRRFDGHYGLIAPATDSSAAAGRHLRSGGT